MDPSEGTVYYDFDDFIFVRWQDALLQAYKSSSRISRMPRGSVRKYFEIANMLIQLNFVNSDDAEFYDQYIYMPDTDIAVRFNQAYIKSVLQMKILAIAKESKFPTELDEPMPDWRTPLNEVE